MIRNGTGVRHSYDQCKNKFGGPTYTSSRTDNADRGKENLKYNLPFAGNRRTGYDAVK